MFVDAGNYIFIADESADSWADSKGIQRRGAEAVVLMHEMAHSMGILLPVGGPEQYCNNWKCVMPHIRIENAGNYDKWYYCPDHWSRKTWITMRLGCRSMSLCAQKR